jgi:type I restriction enzyme S subunit
MRDGWSEKTLDGIADVIMGQSPDGKSYNQEGKGLPFMQGSAEFGEHNPMPEKWCSDPKKIAEPGDLLLSVRAPVGDTNFADQRIAVGRGLSIIRANKKSLTEFIRLVIQMNVAELIASSGSGMFASITGKNLKEFKVNLPPLPEQKRIVDLISSVDSYIEALQQQLESAKKSRNALLHELLTAGGEDWVETTLGEVALLNPSEPALSVTAHFAPMDAVHVGKRWLQYTEERRDRNGARARAGDVLFARITPCLENGKVAQVQSDLERCGGSTEFIVVRGTEKCTSDFLYFWCTLKVNRDKAAELMTGTTGRQRLSWQGLGSLSLWLPSIAEQERIVHNISEFDSFIESTESAITESQNLRSGLLSDLLSGEHEIPASYDKVIGAA